MHISETLFFLCINFSNSDREAAVMYANSWLYHYYTVQSKIQFGIPYEGPARVQPNTNHSYSPHDQHQEQNHHLNDHNHTHSHPHHHPHHNFHHYSPNSLQTSITHSYLTSHHMPSYGYHSPVSQHQSSPGLVNHYGNNTPHLNYHGVSNEGYRPYAYHIEPTTQPVDYSSTIQNQIIVPRRNNNINPIHHDSNTNSSSGSLKTASNESSSPPAKRRIINRLEPLFIPEQNETTTDEPLRLEHSYQTSEDGTVLLTNVLPLRYPHTQLKAIANEPTDLIDQWNPSPPWSETTQKVPDIGQQELCYLSRTPPTPTSAPLTSSNGITFSFDWMPEQFVPIVDSVHHQNNNNNHIVPTALTQINHSTMDLMPIQSNHNEHKFYSIHNLDRSPDDNPVVIKGEKMNKVQRRA